MFAEQLVSGSCACGCSTSDCIQQKIMSATVGGVTPVNCGDNANLIAWINANFSSVSPLSLAWAAHGAGWQYAWSGFFDGPSNTTPDPADTITFDGLITGGSEYPNASVCQSNGAATGATRVAFLLPDSTVQIVGIWFDSGNGYTYQQACIMTGVATGCGYVFDVPIPPIDLCTSSEGVGSGQAPEYAVYPNSKYGGLFQDYLFSDFVTYCTAHPAICASGCTTPGACLSPDPFYGSSPP